MEQHVDHNTVNKYADVNRDADEKFNESAKAISFDIPNELNFYQQPKITSLIAQKIINVLQNLGICKEVGELVARYCCWFYKYRIIPPVKSGILEERNIIDGFCHFHIPYVDYELGMHYRNSNDCCYFIYNRNIVSCRISLDNIMFKFFSGLRYYILNGQRFYYRDPLCHNNIYPINVGFVDNVKSIPDLDFGSIYVVGSTKSGKYIWVQTVDKAEFNKWRDDNRLISLEEGQILQGFTMGDKWLFLDDVDV